MVSYKHSKKNQQQSAAAAAAKGNRLLISINVLGSAGPIRFVVNEKELAAAVIDTALKSYAREGRLPVLGSDLNNFLLYCPNSGSSDFEALSPWETIGSRGCRNFVLCKKKVAAADDSAAPAVISRKGGSGSWKAWINKSLNFKVSSH